MPKTPNPEDYAMNVAAPAGFDARAVPIHKVCIDEKQVAKELLEPVGLKERFRSPPEWQLEITDENRHVIASDIIAKRQSAGKTTKAAVLIPLLMKEDGLRVLLTQRTNHLHDHAGQISFPGGRMDSGDQSPYDTALRESKEEIGLDPNRVEIIGHLPEYLTVSGYSVTPVVGLVQAQAEYVLDEFEVADIFEVPLSFLLDPSNHQVRLWQSEQGGRRFYAMPYGDRFIWGATAGLLRNRYHLLKL